MLRPALAGLAVAVIACSTSKPSPSKGWCESYVQTARQLATLDVKGLAHESAAVRKHDAEELAGLMNNPGTDLAVTVCADAHDDSPVQREARAVRIIDLRHDITQRMILGNLDYAAPMAAPKLAELQQKVDELMDAFSSAAGTSTRRAP